MEFAQLTTSLLWTAIAYGIGKGVRSTSTKRPWTLAT